MSQCSLRISPEDWIPLKQVKPWSKWDFNGLFVRRRSQFGSHTTTHSVLFLLLYLSLLILQVMSCIRQHVLVGSSQISAGRIVHRKYWVRHMHQVIEGRVQEKPRGGTNTGHSTNQLGIFQISRVESISIIATNGTRVMSISGSLKACSSNRPPVLRVLLKWSIPLSALGANSPLGQGLSVF